MLPMATRSTSSAPITRSAWIQLHSRVYSSIRLKTRNRPPTLRIKNPKHIHGSGAQPAAATLWTHRAGVASAWAEAPASPLLF